MQVISCPILRMGEVAVERTEKENFQPRCVLGNVPEDSEMDSQCLCPEQVEGEYMLAEERNIDDETAELLEKGYMQYG